jgi:hypothetical protein
MARNRRRGPRLPGLRPGWTEEVRRRAWKEAKLVVEKLRVDVRRCESAQIRNEGPFFLVTRSF